MPAKRLLASALTILALAIVGYPTGNVEPPIIEAANGQAPFADPDGDMVPNCVEWMMQTDPNRADSDGDSIDDFEEVLTFTNHDPSLTTKPVDYAMRVLTTNSIDPIAGGQVHLHIMIRFVNVTLNNVVIRELYADQNGQRQSLLSLIGQGTRVAQRFRPRDGASFLFSFRLSSENDLRRILPCTLGVMAVVDGKLKNAGTYLMESGSDVTALLPFGASNSLALFPLTYGTSMQDESPYYRGGGRVCEMKLKEIGNGSNVAEITSADCRAAPGLRCSLNCPKKVGSTVSIPDGPGTITGG